MRWHSKKIYNLHNKYILDYFKVNFYLVFFLGWTSASYFGNFELITSSFKGFANNMLFRSNPNCLNSKVTNGAVMILSISCAMCMHMIFEHENYTWTMLCRAAGNIWSLFKLHAIEFIITNLLWFIITNPMCVSLIEID